MDLGRDKVRGGSKACRLVIGDMGLDKDSNTVVTPGGKKDEDSMGRKLDKVR